MMKFNENIRKFDDIYGNLMKKCKKNEKTA